MTETSLTRTILRKLQEYGKCIKIHGSPYMIVGTPDVLMCCDGLMVCIEVKTPEGSLRDAQRHQLQSWQDAGALCLVVTNWDDLEAALKKLLSGVRLLSDFEKGSRGEPALEVPCRQWHGEASTPGDSEGYWDDSRDTASYKSLDELPRAMEWVTGRKAALVPGDVE